MKQTRIEVVEGATIKEAFAYSILYTWVFYRNIWKNINKAVHRLPWVFVGITVMGATVISFALIGKARAERDYYDHKLVKVEQQLNSYRAIVEGRKEVQP